MSEFKKMEQKASEIEEILAGDSLMPTEVAAVGQQLNGMAEALVKYLARRDEYDEVTDPGFLEALSAARAAYDACALEVRRRQDEGARRGAAAVSEAEQRAQGSGAVASALAEDDAAAAERGAADAAAVEAMAGAGAALAALETERPQKTVRRPRYGPSMVARISALEARHAALTGSLPEHAVAAQRREADALASAEAQAARRAEAERDAAAERDAVAARAAAERDAAAAEAQARAAAAAAEAEAAAVREARATEAAVLLEGRRRLEAAARAWPKGPPGVAKAAALLEATEAAADPSLTGRAARALACLSELLAGVVGHPDEERRRTVRLAMPRFRADMGLDTGLQGGPEALYAAGFVLVHRPPPGAAPSCLCAAQVQGERQAPPAGGTARGAPAAPLVGLAPPAAAPPAAPPPGLEAVAVLREPDPFHALDDWTRWFDNLKACAAAVESAATAARLRTQTAGPRW